jgi:hypothetical protein
MLSCAPCCDSRDASYPIRSLSLKITNTIGWSDKQIVEKLAEVKALLEWEKTTGSSRKWWETFETENKHRLALVLRLAEELAIHKATITEFWLCCKKYFGHIL